MVTNELPGERLLYLSSTGPAFWLEVSPVELQVDRHHDLVSCWYEVPTGTMHFWASRKNLYRPDDPEVGRICLLLAAGHDPLLEEES